MTSFSDFHWPFCVRMRGVLPLCSLCHVPPSFSGTGYLSECMHALRRLQPCVSWGLFGVLWFQF